MKECKGNHKKNWETNTDICSSIYKKEGIEVIYCALCGEKIGEIKGNIFEFEE